MRNRELMRIATLFIGAALVMLLVAAGFAHADQDRSGTAAASFLSVGAGAGIQGMGGATLGRGGNLNAAAWNPAALGLMNETEFALSHAGLADQTLQEWVAVGGRAGRLGTRWSLSGLYRGEGTIEGRDASNAPTGDVAVSTTALGVHLAQPFAGLATVGLGLKWVSDRLGPVSGSGVTFDAGVLVRTRLVGFGVVAQNVGGRMNYDGARYPFPTSYGAGVALAPPGTGLTLALDANFPNAYYRDLRTGVEWSWRDRVALRAGYRTELGAPEGERLTGPTFGMGAGLHGLWLDYGYLIPGEGEGQHRLGLTLRPGKLSWSGGDPFNQKSMPRDFDSLQQPSPPKAPEPHK